mgnify:CR=1 FL=1
MGIGRHGLSIGIERVDSEFFLSLKAIGTLQHSDYQIMVPMIESALEGVESPTIKVFFDATELEGWALRAAWDDLKLGLKHGREFSKVAIVGNKKWLKAAAHIANWFVSGKTESFDDADVALTWLQQ